MREMAPRFVPWVVMWTMVSLTKFESSETGIGLWGKDNVLVFSLLNLSPCRSTKVSNLVVSNA